MKKKKEEKKGTIEGGVKSASIRQFEFNWNDDAQKNVQ